MYSDCLGQKIIALLVKVDQLNCFLMLDNLVVSFILVQPGHYSGPSIGVNYINYHGQCGCRQMYCLLLGVVYSNGSYYAVTTGTFTTNAFPLRQSLDLMNWDQIAWVFPDWQANKNPQWAVQDFWAPEIHIVNGRWSCLHNVI